MSETLVHRLRWSPDRFQSFLYDLPDPPLELWTFDGTPRLASWDPKPVYVDQPRLEVPDIWQLVGAAVLVLDEGVLGLLEPLVSSVGELLPLVMHGSREPFFALNILRDIDCLDQRTLSLETLEVYPEFIEHRLPETGLFKVPLLDTTQIFHVKRDRDEDSLIDRILANGLKGPTFEPVWSSRTGAARVNLFSSS